MFAQTHSFAAWVAVFLKQMELLHKLLENFVGVKPAVLAISFLP